MKTTTVDLATGTTNERDLTEQELDLIKESAWQKLRNRRNTLLVGSDWTVLSDSPTSTAAWKIYRQALRDLPANTTDPFNVDWPVPPA